MVGCYDSQDGYICARIGRRILAVLPFPRFFCTVGSTLVVNMPTPARLDRAARTDSCPRNNATCSRCPVQLVWFPQHLPYQLPALFPMQLLRLRVLLPQRTVRALAALRLCGNAAVIWLTVPYRFARVHGSLAPAMPVIIGLYHLRLDVGYALTLPALIPAFGIVMTAKTFF